MAGVRYSPKHALPTNSLIHEWVNWGESNAKQSLLLLQYVPCANIEYGNTPNPDEISTECSFSQG